MARQKANTWPLELDPTENPNPNGALSEPPEDELEDIAAETAEIASYFKTDWRPSAETMALMGEQESKAAFHPDQPENTDEWIRKKIAYLISEGKPVAQAVAIAHSMAGRKDSTSPDLKYSEDEDRDDHGRWTSGGESGPEAGSPGHPIHVESIDEAVKLLGAGKGIMFERPEKAVILLHELSRIANEAKRLGTKAPTYDLCKVSVSNTNLFCAENIGIPRSAMPQLIGKPTPGSPADSLPKNAKGEVDLGPAFRDYLGAQGHVIEDTNEYADRLRASQTEMDGTKVGGMMEAMEAGKIAPAPIFVSDDNYVIDGHHRWAATVGLEYAKDEKLQMPVARIDMKILPALAEANKFAESMGVPQSPVTKAFFANLDLKVFEVPDQKELGSADQADLARENAKIRANVVKPENMQPHHFKPAEWTHPNGHPRCVLCGAEERTDGMCAGDMVPTGDDARSPSRPKDQ